MEEARIKFLLLNGAKVEYSFNNQVTIHQVKQKLIEDWPGEWMNDKPISILALRLLYLGKILEDFKTLKEYKILNGEVSTFHLTILDSQQIENNSIKSKSKKSKKNCFPCLCL